MLAFVGILFLAMRQMGGSPLGASWWLIVAAFSLEVVSVTLAEFYAIRRETIPYRGRSWWLWATGLGIWIWIVSQTGWLGSPFLLLAILALLHCVRIPRRERYSVAGALIGVTLISPLWHTPFSDPWMISAHASRPITVIFLFGAAIVITVIYTLFLAEYRPIQGSFLAGVGTFASGYWDKESLLRAVLTRAVRLYGCDGGLVAEPVDQDRTPDVTCKRTCSGLRVLFRAGLGSDDPPDGTVDLLPIDHLGHEADKRGTAFRRSQLGQVLGEVNGLPARWEFAFTLKRLRSDETIAVIICFSRHRFHSLMPASSYYLDALVAEAQTLYETILVSQNYLRLLSATDRTKIKDELSHASTCLVPLCSRPVTVSVSISSSIPDAKGAIVPVYRELRDRRGHCRYITVMANLGRPTLAAVQTTRRFLQTVANADIVKQIAHEAESLEAANKGLIGLSTLELPGDADLEHLVEMIEMSKDHPYDQAFRGFGFPLLWANRLMRAWFPAIPEGSLVKVERGHETDGSRVFCYHYYNSPTQKNPCWGCPCLSLLVKYIQAADDRQRDRIIKSVEVRPSHSPAGKLKIFRHYELGASLVTNPFPPPEPKPESKSCDRISYIRETVIDRTFEVEVLFVVERAAKVMQTFAADQQKLPDAGYQRIDVVIENMRQVIAEGLGRALQANRVLEVSRPEAKGSGRVETGYVCIAMGATETDRQLLADAERGVIEDLWRKETGILEYLRNRRSLYSYHFSDDDVVPEAIMDEIDASLKRAHLRREAVEVLRQDCPVLFGWSRIAGDQRCFIVEVPGTSRAIVISTGEPEEWEKASDGQELLSRLNERELCQCVGDMYGLLLRSIYAADEYAKFLIANRVAQLLHETSFVFESLPLQASQIRRLIRKGITEMQSISKLIEAYSLGELLAQWYRLNENNPYLRTTLPQHRRHELADAYVAAICPEGRSGLSLHLFDQLGESGIEPSKIPELHKITTLPTQEKSRLLRFLSDIIRAFRATYYIEGVDEFTRTVYRSILDKSQVGRVNVAQCIERTIRLVGDKLPTEFVKVDVAADLQFMLDRGVLYTIVSNLVRNAIEAVADLPGESREVIVAAHRLDDRLVVEVTNPGPEPPAGISPTERAYGSSVSTKPGGKRGLGLTIVKRLADRAGVCVEYERRNELNVFSVTFMESTRDG